MIVTVLVMPKTVTYSKYLGFCFNKPLFSIDRQGYVTDKISLNSLIRRYLPWEEVEKLIPVQRANNHIEPPL
ncbi:hypothetical protein DPMN_171249 [Dreissena polymorpha]|uniref:Uncharacterized protein n=1 Tax=Dreissena polymorpha TaxID=45954 RepID=A0A9D4IDK6_DREPO|nr:hypothetical protein DPMN_171249 [Dreissena polymorpha]